MACILLQSSYLSPDEKSSISQSHSKKLIVNTKDFKKYKNSKNCKLKIENQKLKNWSYYHLLQQIMFIRKLKNDV